MRILTIIVSGFFIAGIFAPINSALQLDGWALIFSGFGVGGLSVIVGNMWYHSIVRENQEYEAKVSAKIIERDMKDADRE